MRHFGNAAFTRFDASTFHILQGGSDPNSPYNNDRPFTIVRFINGRQVQENIKMSYTTFRAPCRYGQLFCTMLAGRTESGAQTKTKSTERRQVKRTQSLRSSHIIVSRKCPCLPTLPSPSSPFLLLYPASGSLHRAHINFLPVSSFFSLQRAPRGGMLYYLKRVSE